jgi:uncharacterized protein YceK
MRIGTIASVLCVTLSGCASLRVVPPAPHLPDVERDVISALLFEEARHPEKPRPILILNPTDPWMPADEPTPERPADVPPDVWAEIYRPLPPSLREVNRVPYDLGNVALPPGAVLYPRAQFDREYKSRRSFRSLVRRLGGVEPLVLSVSRPAIHDDRQSASVLLHVLSTWSGCGGVDEFAASRSGDGWVVDLGRVLVVW